MKISEIREKKDKELASLLNEKRKELRDARFGNAGGKNRDLNYKKKLRADIARVLTEMRNRVENTN